MFIKLVKFNGVAVGLQVKDRFFPVVTDQLGSIRALLSEDGKSIIFERSFDAWGNKSVVFNSSLEQKQSALLEKLCVFSFAGLIENPLLSGAGIQLYWSQSRVYSPAAQEWLSADPLLKWNPSAIVNHPGNFIGTRYANNDPVNLIDPTGGFVVPAVILVGLLSYELFSGQSCSRSRK